jgi:hypothetical protein
MKNKISLALVISSVALLSACGGGGGTPSTAAGDTTFAGKVIDGYVSGAKVCIDINSNAICDPNEPAATTDSTGSYSFTYSGAVAGMHIIAEVPVGAVDSDLGAVTKTYSLFAPAASASVVTPLSTLVSSEMIANKSTASVAEQSVKNALNLNAITNLVGYDFKKANDTQTTTLAQIIVAAIANTSEILKNDTTYQAANISAGDTIKQAITQVKNNILPQVINVDGTLAMTGATAVDRINQINAIAVTTLSGRVDNIVAATKSGDGSVASMADVFKQGLVLATNNNGRYHDENNISQLFSNKLTAELIKFDIATQVSAPLNYKKVLIQTSWLSTYDTGEDWYFDGTNWVQSTTGVASAKPVFRENCVDLPQTVSGNVIMTACGVAKDVSNKTIADFIPNICKGDNGIAISGCNVNSTFPTNSIGYDLTLSYPQETYRLSANNVASGSDRWTGYNTLPANSTDIVDFIAYTKVNHQYQGNGCNTAFKVLSYDPTAKTGKLGWASTGSKDCSNLSGSYSYALNDQTNFSVITVGGKNLMKAEVSSLYRKNNPGSNKIYMLFGYLAGSVNSGIWSGDYMPANYKQSIPFTGDPGTNTQIVSPVLFNAVLAAKKLAAFPYPN